MKLIHKIEPTGGQLEKNLSSSRPNIGSIISVANLYQFVKRSDKDFVVAPEVSPDLLNKDRTQKALYHQTENEFTEFNPNDEGTGSNDDETPFGIFMKPSNEDIGLKGKKQMALLLRKLFSNGCEIVYDKTKMNGRYQVGSGRVVTVTHDTPFIENSISQPDGKVNRKQALSLTDDEGLSRAPAPTGDGASKVTEYMLMQSKLDSLKYHSTKSAVDFYYATAGEIEAREASERRRMTPALRRMQGPSLPKNNVVFAEGADRFFQAILEGDREYLKPITLEDIEILRTIGRKSINKFTSEDIKKAQKWAYKFYKELGVKSPFFRAWFGDWRAHETKDFVPIVKEKENTKYASGKVRNIDVGTTISWGHELKSETINHLAREKVSQYALYDIQDIIESAVYLDTVISMPTSKTKMPNTAFMHSFYSLYRTKDGGTHLLKIYIEEALSNNQKEIFKRGYQLKDIKKVADIPNSVLSQKGGLTDNTSATVYSIADLYELVKEYDKDFVPAPEVNPALFNKDGTQKVLYHQTENEFTEFNPNDEGTGSNDDETPFGIFMKPSNEDIGLRGKKQIRYHTK